MKIIKISAGDKEKIDTIVQILSRFSTDKGFSFSPSDICLALTEGEVVFGGLIAEVNWDWIYIKIMAIEPRAQRRGYGKELIKAVEEFGRKENLVGIWVDTFTFQSPSFYESAGFEEFARLPNYPRGHERIFFRKFIQ